MVRGRGVGASPAGGERAPRPPSFVLFCSRADAVPESYLRYLVHGLRERFELPGTPIRITLREKANPFAGRKSRQR
jgi:GTP-binding protein